jgi:glycosyltransferase involved in cell wall biosynthesis
VFVSVGNWMRRKGTLELINAFARLRDHDAVLHLAGRTDIEPRYTRQVRARLAATGLGSRVVVHGAISVNDVARLYAAADVFVLPSYREPYGTVYGEALAAGLPLVGWRAGNLPHLIENGVEGILVEPGDIEGLASALRLLAADPVRRERMAAAALARGQSLPTWEDSAAAFFATLRQSLSIRA